ncbi:protein FAR1-RELATED SEQUENCE 5-like [Rutidosis leptorrhynchoides]|uniref:protein FAR1-RELATED SEQUENCE 5-like n=1 Tax=Rutidosis leptorrhynchoides TaxID=125765 RepID=UPI003A99A8A4
MASKNDCKNWKRDVNKYILKADAEMFVQMLTAKKNCERQELAGAFWADATSKRNYKSFRGVVSFDATFRTNMYDMVFIPFTDIDIHFKCVTFGAALLAKEDVQHYDWLLKAFKKAFPVVPQIVMTDQDPSMLIAVQSVFLTARHRLGSICNQIGSNLHVDWVQSTISFGVGHAISRAGFKSNISNIVWTDRLDPDEFDRRWFSILHKYNLDDHNWLIDMFNLRQKWIPAYFRDWDMSGLMRTSSRSESGNHVFQQLMSRSSTLVEFISFFETAMEIQRYEQSKNDHESLYTTPKIETQHPMEKHAGKVFTRAAFFMIQGQMQAATRYCMSYKIQKLSEDTTKFCIGDTSVKTSKLMRQLT